MPRVFRQPAPRSDVRLPAHLLRGVHPRVAGERADLPGVSRQSGTVLAAGAGCKSRGELYCTDLCVKQGKLIAAGTIAVYFLLYIVIQFVDLIFVQREKFVL